MTSDYQYTVMYFKKYHNKRSNLKVKYQYIISLYLIIFNTILIENRSIYYFIIVG